MRLTFILIALALCLPALALATVYHTDEFSSGVKNWVQSDYKKADGAAGPLKWTAGKWFGDAEMNKGFLLLIFATSSRHDIFVPCHVSPLSLALSILISVPLSITIIILLPSYTQIIASILITCDSTFL